MRWPHAGFGGFFLLSIGSLGCRAKARPAVESQVADSGSGSASIETAGTSPFPSDASLGNSPQQRRLGLPMFALREQGVTAVVLRDPATRRFVLATLDDKRPPRFTELDVSPQAEDLELVASSGQLGILVPREE